MVKNLYKKRVFSKKSTFLRFFSKLLNYYFTYIGFYSLKTELFSEFKFLQFWFYFLQKKTHYYCNRIWVFSDKRSKKSKTKSKFLKESAVNFLEWKVVWGNQTPPSILDQKSHKKLQKILISTKFELCAHHGAILVEEGGFSISNRWYPKFREFEIRKRLVFIKENTI